MAERKFFNLPNRRHNAPFSDAVLIGDTLYLSGRIGYDPETMTVPADVDEEITRLLDGLRDVLKLADMTMDDLVYLFRPVAVRSLQRPVSLVFQQRTSGAGVSWLRTPVAEWKI